MTKILSVMLAAVFVLIGLSVTSNAQTRHPRGINQREARQQRRIAQGVKSGELTAKETYRLEKEQVRLRNLEGRLRDSGDRLTPKERARLERDLNRASRDIYRQKHDGQDRLP
jgi:hypothetical protein